MRTTMNIDDEALFVIKKHAEQRGISLGQATSDLVSRGAQCLPQFQMKNGWFIFDVPPGTPPITNEMLDAWEEEDTEQEYQRAVSPRR